MHRDEGDGDGLFGFREHPEVRHVHIGIRPHVGAGLNVLSEFIGTFVMEMKSGNGVESGD